MDPKTNTPAPPPKKPERKKPPQVKPPMPMKGFAVWFILMALVFVALDLFGRQQTADEKLAYNPDFIEYVKTGKII